MHKSKRFPKSLYEIYVSSFQDSNDDGIGDLEGIRQRLDYLSDLGIEAIKLSPIWESPWFDGGYDISNHVKIAPRFGTLNDFKKLVTHAHERQLKIVVDYVPNHTSSQHKWFQESRKSKDNPYRDYYIWKDPRPDGSPPNNWVCQMENGSAWEYDPQTQQYYYHNFLKQQPDLNWRNPKVRSEMYAVLKQLLDFGVDGIRMDAVRYLMKDKLFRDEPINQRHPKTDRMYDSLQHIYTRDQEELFTILREMCNIVKSYPGTFLISETYADTDEERRKYFEACAPDVHTIFNFDLIFLPFAAKEWQNAIESYLSSIPTNAVPVFSLGNHDRVRLATRLGGERQARITAFLQLTLPGFPAIYYGDEIGMEQVSIPADKIRDTYGKNIPSKNRDGERTPMQWNNTAQAGFSKVSPFLPVGKDYEQRNVAIENKKPNSILQLYKNLLRERNVSNILQNGTYESVSINKSVYGYIRSYKDESYIIVLNFVDNHQGISLPFSQAKLIINTSLNNQIGTTTDLNDFVLSPYEGYLFHIK